MLKTENTVKIEREAGDHMSRLLRRIPGLKAKLVNVDLRNVEPVDLVFELHGLASKRVIEVGCVVKLHGQPKYAREAYFDLMTWAAAGQSRVPVFIAPYLHPKSREFIESFAGNYLDFVGNARLAFEQIYIELASADVPKAAARELRSLFTPKAALVIRALLRSVGKPWKVADLAAETSVSLGQISNVIRALNEREFAERGEGGVFLSDPNKLIEAWADAYRGVDGVVRSFHTTLHGKALEDALRHTLLAYQSGSDGNVVLASFSAANWLAPYGRSNTTYFYADATGLENVIETLKLRPVTSGANVEITIPGDHGVFFDAVALAPGVFCTSPIQTYLDLLLAGERGKEAAEFLKERIDLWQPLTK
ncbi:type IV toxin-antitoxin system AbiEi family antitoxin [Pseudoduganella sp. R-34]|uniref:type IV toxin-antitoxin system AbiEi family antitoxin n=1 Tax=Pseudoduganella sp. R-34 TaxID=3404062 RepID=UPI003CE6B3E2